MQAVECLLRTVVQAALQKKSRAPREELAAHRPPARARLETLVKQKIVLAKKSLFQTCEKFHQRGST
jgi:hypothetical protein